jgi:chemotaxis protein methyltransferase CheR
VTSPAGTTAVPWDGSDPGELARLREVVRERVGISVPAGRLAELGRAARAAVEREEPAGTETAGAAAVAGLIDRGSAGYGVLDTLVAGMNLGETYFFRDAEQMAALEGHILPEVIARRRAEHRLRIWSAGCSTGEEPYTLAILLARLLPDLPRWDVLVLGTDVNGASLRRARRGVYRAWSLRGATPESLAPHLVPDGPDFAVSAAIRAMVTFDRLNLAVDRYPDALDLVLCRNVLLYFDTATGRRVVGRLRDALSPGGWLLLSPVEAGLATPAPPAVDAPPGTVLLGTVAPELELSGLHPAVFRRPAAGLSRVDARLSPVDDPGPVTGPSRVDGRAPSARPSRVDDLGRIAPRLSRTDSSSSGVEGPPRAGSPVPDVGLLPPGRADEAGAAAVYAAAHDLWRDGADRDALVLLADGADRYPLAADLHFLHGLVLLDGRRPSEALTAFRRCTYAEPAFVLAHLGLAGALGRVGQRRQAVASVDTAERLLAVLDDGAAVPHGGGLRPAELRELIAAHRQLLAAPTGGRDD